jgi:hypothetical protein
MQSAFHLRVRVYTSLTPHVASFAQVPFGKSPRLQKALGNWTA